MTHDDMGWLPVDDIGHRIDANYNRPEAVQARRQLESTVGSVALGTLSTKVVCGPFGSTLTTRDIDPEGGVALVNPTDISRPLFNLKPEWRISHATLSSKGLPLYQPETMVFARVGIYPHCGVLPPQLGDATISSRIIAARIDDKKADPYFLMAYFRTPIGQVILYSIQKITAQPVIGTDELSSAMVPCPRETLQAAIGNKIRAAERLRASAENNRREAIRRVNSFFDISDFSDLKPNSDGSCNHFSSFAKPEDLGSFHGAQFFAPKRRRAVDVVSATGIAEKVGQHSRRVRRKAKRTASRPHLDPANVSVATGFWHSTENKDGGDVALADAGCMLFMRMRPYLNKITINDLSEEVSASLEFLIYRFDGDDAYYVAICLRRPWGLAQVAELASGDRPRVDGDFVDEILVPWPERSVRQEIGGLYRACYTARRRADQLVKDAISDAEKLVDGTLDDGECLAEGAALKDEFSLEPRDG